MESKIKVLFVDFVGFERTVKVMSYARGIAKTVNHPISNAVFCLDERIEPVEVKKIKEFKDFGILGEVNGEKVLLGNEKVFKEENIMLKGDTKDKVFLAINNQVQAVFRLEEK